MNYKHISHFSLNVSTHIDELTPMEKGMLQELMKIKKDLDHAHFTIAYISQLLNVSTTSLHRLSKKLGYSSFTLMKEDYFAKKQIENDTSTSFDYLTMICNSYDLIKQSITEEMLECMFNAEKITIYGMGMSSYIGKMFQIKLQLLGVPTEQYDDSRFMKLSSHILVPQKDVLIILSRSGCPPELIEAMNEAHKKGVASILITESEKSLLRDMATYVVFTSNVLDNDDDVDTRVNAHIAMDLIIKAYIKYKERKQNDE